jgi:hypothetical protein
LGTGTGGAGTYNLSISQTVSSGVNMSAGLLSGTVAANSIDAIILDTTKFLTSTAGVGTIAIRFAPAASSALYTNHALKVGFIQLP